MTDITDSALDAIEGRFRHSCSTRADGLALVAALRSERTQTARLEALLQGILDADPWSDPSTPVEFLPIRRALDDARVAAELQDDDDFGVGFDIAMRPASTQEESK